MANYTKTTNFTVKDNLTSGDPAKVVKGAELDTEFNNLQIAINSKPDANNGILTGTATANTINAQTVTTNSLSLDGVEITASSSEINTLDGFTGSVSDLNKLASVTATADELNVLDGSTATTGDLNKLADVTASALEINTLDGLTASTAELNTLDGFTGSVDDLNYAKDLRATGVTTTEFDKLDGLTPTTTELNYVDGVTSPIQTQLNAKAPINNPSFTGDANFDSGTLFVDASKNNVGIGLGVSSPNEKLMVLTDTGYTAAFNTNVTSLASTSISIGGFSNSAGGRGGSVSIKAHHHHSATTASQMSFEVNGDQEAMRIDSNGNVGIGVTSSAWDVTGAGGPVLQIKRGMLFGSDTETRLIHNAVYNTGNFRYIATGVAATNYQQSDGTHKFFTAPSGTAGNAVLFTQAMTLDNSGNLLVGKTATNTLSTNGHDYAASGYVMHTRDSSNVMYLNRKTTDGNIVEFYKDGSTVGSIGTGLSSLAIGKNNTQLLFWDAQNGIFPSNGTTVTDDSIDFGNPNYRFKDLYLSGGVYLGGTGAANYLGDYEEGSWIPSYSGTTTNPAITYSFLRDGRYTKIGNVVIATFIIKTDSVSGGSGNLNVSGLPFPVVATSAFNAGSVIISEVANFAGSAPLAGRASQGSTAFSLQTRTTIGASSETQVPVSVLATGPNSNTLAGTVIYYTTDS